MRPAARLLSRTGSERNRAAAAPRPVEVGNCRFLDALRFAINRLPDEGERREKNRGRSFCNALMPAGVRSHMGSPVEQRGQTRNNYMTDRSGAHVASRKLSRRKHSP